MPTSQTVLDCARERREELRRRLHGMALEKAELDAELSTLSEVIRLLEGDTASAQNPPEQARDATPDALAASRTGTPRVKDRVAEVLRRGPMRQTELRQAIRDRYGYDVAKTTLSSIVAKMRNAGTLSPDRDGVCRLAPARPGVPASDVASQAKAET